MCHILVFICAASIGSLPKAVTAGDDFPRLVNLWGCDIYSTDYHKWGAYDYIVISGGEHNALRTFKAGCRSVNPNFKLYSHTALMFCQESDFWMTPDMWLYSSGGYKLQTGWGANYLCNLTSENYQNTILGIINWMYDDLVDDGTIEGLFFDMVVPQCTFWNNGDVDTDRNGAIDDPNTVNPLWNDRQNLFFQRLRYDTRYTRQPYCMANDLSCGSRSYANGRLWEGERMMDPMMNYRKNTPADVIRGINKWFDRSSRDPKHAFASMSHPRGWQAWRVGMGLSGFTDGELDMIQRDYPRMRQGLLTALMTDAYYFYDVGTTYYGAAWWYDEYNHNLGQPVASATEVMQGSSWVQYHWLPGNPWTSTLFSFDNASIDGTTGEIVANVTSTANQWNKLFSTNSTANNFVLSPNTFYRVEATCLIEAEPTYEFFFRAHSPAGSLGNALPYHDSCNSQNFHEKGIIRRVFRDGGSTWNITATFCTDNAADYTLEWWVQGAGRFRVKELKITQMPPTYYVRDFANGRAYINTSPVPITVDLGQTMRMLDGTQAPKYIIERDDWPSLDGSSYSRLTGGWNQASTMQARNTGFTYDYAQSSGRKCKWTWTAPATGTYAVYVCIPQVSGATGAARYKHQGIQVDISQSGRDGGWVFLFNSDQMAGNTYELELNSLNSGKTIADSIRIESLERYYNGALVTNITLPPYDGYILKRLSSEPIDVTVTDEGVYSRGLSQLSASWQASNPSLVDEYSYAVGTSPTNIWFGWVSSGTATQAMVSNLNLQQGQVYYWYVKARSGADWSEIATSDGVTAARKCSIGEAKKSANNTPVYIENAVVTSATTDFAGLWVQTDNLSDGIKIGNALNCGRWQRSDIAGLTQWTDGIPVLNQAELKDCRSGNAFSVPGSANRTIANDSQEALNYQGIDLVGRIFTTWGTVRYSDSVLGLLYIDDGSNLVDGLGIGATKFRGLRIECAPGSALPANGEYAQVTGIRSVKKVVLQENSIVNGELRFAGETVYVPVMYVRSSEDIRNLTP